MEDLRARFLPSARPAKYLVAQTERIRPASNGQSGRGAIEELEPEIPPATILDLYLVITETLVYAAAATAAMAAAAAVAMTVAAMAATSTTTMMTRNEPTMNALMSYRQRQLCVAMLRT